MFRAIRCPVWLVDADTFAIVDANAATEELFGYTRQELLTMRIDQLMQTTDADSFHAKREYNLRNWGDGGSWNMVTKDGAKFRAVIRFHVTSIGQRPVFFIFPVELEGHPTFQLPKPVGSEKLLRAAAANGR